MENKGTYAKVVLSQESQQKITAIAHLINLENYVRPNDLHVTIIYSRKECFDIENIPVSLPIVAHGIAFDIFLNNDGTKCLVLLLDSLKMQELHKECINEYGATHDYPTYRPHLTLSHDYENGKIPNEEWLGYFKYLVFDQYVVMPLDIEWGTQGGNNEQEN